MSSVHDKFNHFFEFAPQFLLPIRWYVLSVFLVITVLSTYAMVNRFEMDMSLESWFNEGDPAKIALDKFRQQFGSDDGVYIVYRVKDGNVFSSESLTQLQNIHNEIDDTRLKINQYETSELNLLQRINRVDSLINTRYQIAEGDTLISSELVGLRSKIDKTTAEKIKNIALSQENIALAFYSDDFQYGGIRIKTDFGIVPNVDVDTSLDEDDLLTDDFDWQGEDIHVNETLTATNIVYKDMQMEEYLLFMTELKSILESDRYSNFEFYYTGNAPMMEFAMENMKQATFLLILVVVVIVGFLWFLFHSLSAVVWPIVVIAGSAFWTIGLGTLIGVTFSNMVSLTFMLILAVGVADCVHVLSAYILYRRALYSHREAMVKAYRKTGLPILLTTITTMVGMLALLISDIPQIGVFGVSSAVGVLVAFLLTIFVLPVLLDIWHPYSDKKVKKIESHNKKHWLQPVLDKIPQCVGRFPKLIVLFYVTIFAFFMYNAFNVEIDSNFAELTRKGSTVRVTYEIIDKKMMGAQNMELMLDFGEEDALKRSDVLFAIDEFQQKMHDDYAEFVIKTFSIADFVKDTYRVMNSGDQAFYTIPNNNRLVAQLLYLFDNANPEDRRMLVSDDYSKSHITLQLKNKGSYEYSQFFKEIQQEVDVIFTPVSEIYPDMQLHTTGTLALMMSLVDKLSWAQLKSFSFALVVITLLLMVTLGSIQAGLISMVPNLLPAFFTFGMMGLLNIPLDTDTLIIAPLIIGIAVDDTIHFVSHYRDAWFQTGDVDKALHSTIKEVGQAVTFTTLILGVGFSMLAFSDYLGIAKTGIFGSLAIFVALSSDLLLLPALIKWIKPDLGRKKYLSVKKALNGEKLCS